ncbi:MAG: CHAT domain-containing protein [Acidobacteriia bacterium]|nr:CHAT domain-containing protein [Terriglobia bacterium]
MAATRPSSAIRAGSPDSSRWDTKDFTELIQVAQARRAAGDFAGLESVYTQGYQRAKALRNGPAAINYLSNLGTVRMLLLRYSPALQAYLEACKLAERAGDWFALGAIAVNLSQIYERMGDADAALSALERGKSAIDRLRTSPPYKARLLMRLRSVRAALQENRAEHRSLEPDIEPRYEDAIEAARLTDDPKAEAEAAAWDLLGKEKIAAGEFEEAEAALGGALRLRTSYSPKNLYFSYAALGALRLAQADQARGEERRRRANEAEVFTDRAIETGSSAPGGYELVHQRGRTREILGQTELALEDFSTTVNQASQWNGAVPAARALVTGANVAMQHEIFDSFVEAAARQALRTGDRNWAAKAFLALEANRAVSLRESRELAHVWKEKLPVAYWETLGRLNQQEARDLSTTGTISAASKSLHLELIEMESAAGVGVSVTLAENFRTRNSLSHFQQGLGKSDLLLSFYLGKQESYLWAVTKTSIELHKLPAESEVREDIKRFREAVVSDVRGGRRAGEKLGADLYQKLFGSLRPADAAKRSWLLSLDGALFELPFAALVSGYENGQPVYAVERHSSQVVPGALFLTGDTAPPGGFLGVGDPVYNSADPRWKPDPAWRLTWPPRVSAASPEDRSQLNRLVSSAHELRRSSQSWQADIGPQPIQLLEGTAAQRDAFLEGLNAAPSTVHLATHVLAPGLQSEQAFLVFSLDSSGKPGLLSTSDIGMLHVPGALIVMTGCATGAGDARAGAGLLGLTRAWMMAGARAVVATHWPVPDVDSDLMPAFYRFLRTNSTAEALRRSQVELIRSGTWQASPSYWAAFQVMGGGR